MWSEPAFQFGLISHRVSASLLFPVSKKLQAKFATGRQDGLSIFPPPLGLPQGSGGLANKKRRLAAPLSPVFFLFSAADYR